MEPNVAELYPDLKDRPLKNTICLFDVDDTLTPPRSRVSEEMLKLLSEVRHKCATGFVCHLSAFHPDPVYLNQNVPDREP